MTAFLAALARFVFGLVFVYAASLKIADPAGFAAEIFQYQLLPDHLIYPAALFVPWLEAVCGLCLWAGAFKRGAAAMLSLLLAVFMVAMGVTLLRFGDVGCGCFGKAGSAGIKEALWRDGAILALGLYVMWTVRRRPAPTGDSGVVTYQTCDIPAREVAAVADAAAPGSPDAPGGR